MKPNFSRSNPSAKSEIFKTETGPLENASIDQWLDAEGQRFNPPGSALMNSNRSKATKNYN